MHWLEAKTEAPINLDWVLFFLLRWLLRTAKGLSSSQARCLVLIPTSQVKSRLCICLKIDLSHLREWLHLLHVLHTTSSVLVQPFCNLQRQVSHFFPICSFLDSYFSSMWDPTAVKYT